MGSTTGLSPAGARHAQPWSLGGRAGHRLHLAVATLLCGATVLVGVGPVTAEPASPVTTGVKIKAVPVPTVPAGTAVEVHARLFEAGTGAALADTPVEVWARVGGTATFRRLATVTTRADGVALHRFTPRFSQVYQVRFAGNEAALASASPTAVVRLATRVSVAATPSQVVHGSPVTLAGGIAPGYLGVPVVVQQRVGGAFRTVRTAVTTTGGRWSVRLTASAAGPYRVVLPRTDRYDAATATVPLRVDLRTLRPGDRGGEVLALEQALVGNARADVGAVDGVYDNDTRHAVTAFQKSVGLPRTGVADAVTFRRLAVTRPGGPRVVRAGGHVEINLAQQVLRLYDGARLMRLVDISSGNNRYYVSEGVVSRAFTPVGSFRVERKINGIRVSKLGELYRPAYFVGGWAVHGSPSVPPFPASHGCVRVTFRQMDRLYPLLPVGTPVTIYRS